MVRRQIIRLCSSFAALLVLMCAPSPALAATQTTSGNGLKISPVVTDLTISAGGSQIVPIIVQNVTSGTVTLQAIVNDFTAGTDETGIPSLLLDPNQYAPTHSLKRFVGPIGNITLGPNEHQQVNAVITIPKDAAAGGYYGAVRFAPAANNGASNVTLVASVGSLILVKVPGNIREAVKLVSFDIRTKEDANPQVLFTSNKNLVAVARFQNTGDVQEQPFGKVYLTSGSTQLATYKLNDAVPPNNVLPDSIRRFSVTLDKVGIFGKYTVSGYFGYGSTSQSINAQTTFYVVPVGYIVIVIVFIVLLLFAIFGARPTIRKYNQRIIRRASRG